MSNEIQWLALLLGFTLFLWMPYVMNRLLVRGLMGVFSNPSAGDAPLAPWAQRARAAHANAIENLAVFAPAVLAVHVLDRGNSVTAFACGLYFFSRLAHMIVYVAGLPILRTLAFFGGWVGTAILVLRLLGLL